MYDLIQTLDIDMDHNDPLQPEELTKLITQRGEVIQRLDQLLREPTSWSPTEQQKLEQMKEWEEHVQHQIQTLYHSFSTQFQKLQLGKQLSQHYQGGYEPVYTDGAYIDKRK